MTYHVNIVHRYNVEIWILIKILVDADLHLQKVHSRFSFKLFQLAYI